MQTSTHPATHSFISFVHSDHRRAPTTDGVLVDGRPGAPRTPLKVRLDCPELRDNVRCLGSPRKKATVMSGGLSAGAAVCKPPEQGGGVHFMLTHEAGQRTKPLLSPYVLFVSPSSVTMSHCSQRQPCPHSCPSSPQTSRTNVLLPFPKPYLPPSNHLLIP